MKMISRLIAGIYDGLECWPGYRFMCCLITALVTLEFLVLAAVTHISGQVPYVEKFHGIFFVWQLPFAVSRLWDVLLLPLFVLAMYGVSCLEESTETCDWKLENYEHPFVVDLLGYAVVFASFGTLAFGIVYYVPIFIATLLVAAILFIAVVALCFLGAMCMLVCGLVERCVPRMNKKACLS